jgi:long-chain acyl-CoA synthetase
MPENVPNDIWADSGLGGALRPETHHDGRKMLCFTERPPTLAHMFDDLVGRFPLRPAIVEDRTITYRELDDLVGKISASLSATNVLRGDRVALFLGNCWEFLACVLACCRIGAIVVPIGTRQRHAELAFLLNDSEAKVLVFEADLADSVPGSDELPALRHRFAIRGTAPRARPFADLLAAREPVTRAADLRDEDVAVILYTSGTTGRPKGAQLTHLGIVHSALTFARCFALSEVDRGLVAVPLSHVTGLVGVALSTIIAGGSVILMRQAYKTPDFLALAAREQITIRSLFPQSTHFA